MPETTDTDTVHPFPRVKGYCPACGHQSLFVAKGGYITCSMIGCPDPIALADILAEREVEHIVTFDNAGWTVRHPLLERKDHALESCGINDYLSVLDGPPPQLGSYRTHWNADDARAESWDFLGVLS